MIREIIASIYKRHTGLVFKLNKNFISNTQLPSSDYKCAINNNAKEISEFYLRVGSSHLNYEVIKQYLENKTQFFCIKYKNKIIALNAIFTHEAYYPGLSFYCMINKQSNKIILDINTAYSGMVVVDPLHRGKNLYLSLVGYIFKSLIDKNINNIILTTGISNSSMIRATLNMNGKLIRIVEVKRLFKYLIFRDIVYNDKDEVNWICK